MPSASANSIAAHDSTAADRSLSDADEDSLRKFSVNVMRTSQLANMRILAERRAVRRIGNDGLAKREKWLTKFACVYVKFS
jgi:hypothetical protein